MEQILDGVYRILPTKVTPSKYVSFLVRRTQGNFLLPCCSSHGSISSSFDAIEQMGGIRAQLLGDMHFASQYNNEIFARFGVGLYTSDVEAPDVRRKVKEVVEFPFVRHTIFDCVECIPTPGHRPGAVSYLFVNGAQRLLFAGDSIYHDGTQWRTYVSKANKKIMKTTLKELAEIDFDYLFANTSVTNPICYVELSEQQRLEFLQALIDDL